MTQMRAGAGAAQMSDALREERSRTLARRGHAVVPVAATRPYLVCACGGDRFGLALAQVAQVLPVRPMTPLPGAPPAILGLVALSGRIVTLLALARALGRADEPETAIGHVVVMRGSTAPVALAVDRVIGVAEIHEAALVPVEVEAGLSGEAVSGYAPAGGGPGVDFGFVVVDLPRLVRRYLS